MPCLLLLEASARFGGRAFTQDLGGYPLDLGCEWLHLGDRDAWVGIAEASGFPVDRGDPPWAQAHPGIAQNDDDEHAARWAFGDWEKRLRPVAQGSDRASDALEPGGEWNSYVRAIAGFMSGVAPERISTTGYPTYDDASTGENWNLPLGYGTLVAASLPSSTALRLATPAEGPAAGFAHVMAELFALFGSNVASAIRPLAATSWSRMASIGGAYSCALPGQAGARARLAQPFEDRLFFAGEATHPFYFTTAHGAHDSGQRAADEALAALKGRVDAGRCFALAAGTQAAG